MRCFRGNTWNARLFTEGTDNCPTVMSAERRRWCSMLVTSIFPHRPADEADNDWSLVRIAFRSSSLRIERIATLLPNLPGIRPKRLLNIILFVLTLFAGTELLEIIFHVQWLQAWIVSGDQRSDCKLMPWLDVFCI